MDMRAAMLDTAEVFLELVSSDAVGVAWGAPSAVDGYTVGELVAHAGSSVAWAARLAATPPVDGPPTIERGELFAPMRREPDDEGNAFHDGVHDRAAAGAERGHAATLGYLTGVVEELRSSLPDLEVDGCFGLAPIVDRLMRVEDFLATRLVEVIVHADDIAVSVPDAPAVSFSRDANSAVIDVAMATARVKAGDVEVIRALTRRERTRPDVLPVF